MNITTWGNSTAQTIIHSKTITAQQRYLETNKTRKVLQQAKMDSASLYVHHDTASLTSRMTDNLSKISRIFEFDSNIFSTGVYERAFRGSIRDVLKRRQYAVKDSVPTSVKTVVAPIPTRLINLRLLGPDQIGMDLLINSIQTDRAWQSHHWILYQKRLRDIWSALACDIIETCSDSCDLDNRDVLVSYLKERSDLNGWLPFMRPEALEAFASFWRNATQFDQEDPAAYGSSRKEIKMGDMVFWVHSRPNHRVKVAGGNYLARLYVFLYFRMIRS